MKTITPRELLFGDWSDTIIGDLLTIALASALVGTIAGIPGEIQQVQGTVSALYLVVKDAKEKHSLNKEKEDVGETTAD